MLCASCPQKTVENLLEEGTSATLEGQCVPTLDLHGFGCLLSIAENGSVCSAIRVALSFNVKKY